MTAPPAELPSVATEPARRTADSDQLAGATRPVGLAAAWRRSRAPLAVLAFVALGLFIVVLLAPRAKSNTYLDPAGTDDFGTKALADILTQRGFAVTAVYSPTAALAAIGKPGLSPPSRGQPRPAPTLTSTLVITNPDLLTTTERARLARAAADLVLVEPGPAALATFAPALAVADSNAPFGEPVSPACPLVGAQLAGSADEGGITYRSPARAISCYLVDGHPSVVRYRAAGRTVTVLGSGLPLSNGWLVQQGNAALALNLLNDHNSVVWLTPEPTVAKPPPPAVSQRPGPSIIPSAAWLVVLQLCVALVLAALWRARRFGPLIPERLPVVVRASETVEGHARLYEARRARDRAATALREDLLSRIKPALGLVPDAPMEVVTGSLASRSRRGRQEIEAILYGLSPVSNADLVRLARHLDELEREVRTQ